MLFKVDAGLSRVSQKTWDGIAGTSHPSQSTTNTRRIR